MIKINKNTGDISYTKDDTFSLICYPRREGVFSEGCQMRFCVAENEETDHIIDNTYSINDDMTFTITLSERDKSKLNIGEYKYKMIVIKDNKTVTRKSGYFIVKWGA